ncbi:replication-relaxation family protein [Virgibacillus flavescens]|uniref:replication-relaxation family protein n=1 Tax=Virgibacillus flavescens TaxID=1611422 RepID=UPI003D33D2B9
MKEKSYYLGENGKGVKLKEFELEMLKFLFQQKLLTSKQLYTYFNYFSDLSYNTFRNKIWRWSKYKVIKMKNITLKKRWGNEANIITIGTNGIKILISEGYLPESFSTTSVKSNFSIYNYDHYFGTQQTVLNTILRLKTYGVDIDSIRPSDFPLEMHENSQYIVPDWILRSENKLLLIETDMGNEPLGTLVDKVKRYVEIKKNYPDYEFIVLFVLIDDSLNTQKIYKNNGEKRLANMKKVFLNLNLIHDLNFSLNVSHLKQSAKIAENLLLDSKVSSRQLMIAQKSLEELNQQFDYTFTELNDEQVYLHDTPEFLYADRAFRLSNLAQTYSTNVLFVVVTEGNIQQLDRLYYLNLAIQKGLFREKVDKIIAIYQKKDDWMNDNFGQGMQHVLVADTETWLQNLKSEPDFYKVIGPNKLKHTVFED